jgi:hypothetical protein
LDWAAAVRALVVDDSRAVDEKEAMGAREFVILASDDRLRIARRRWRLLDRLAVVFVVFVVIVASGDAVFQDRVEVGFNVVFVFVVVVGTRASGSGDVVFVFVFVFVFVIITFALGGLGVGFFRAFKLVFFAVELLAVGVVFVASGSRLGLVVFWGSFVSHRFLRL